MPLHHAPCHSPSSCRTCLRTAGSILPECCKPSRHLENASTCCPLLRILRNLVSSSILRLSRKGLLLCWSASRLPRLGLELLLPICPPKFAQCATDSADGSDHFRSPSHRGHSRSLKGRTPRHSSISPNWPEYPNEIVALHCPKGVLLDLDLQPTTVFVIHGCQGRSGCQVSCAVRACCPTEWWLS